jgi:type II secretory pathway pseudopilin PulG
VTKKSGDTIRIFKTSIGPIVRLSSEMRIVSPISPRLRPEGGYTLVALVIIFAVMTILLAAVLPSWTTMLQREKEEELVFRGLQYAEAIRVFQVRFGRYPVRLEELIEVRPRSIRQLWADPMTDGGQWGLVFAQASPDRRRGRRGRQDGDEEDSDPSQQPRELTGASAPSDRASRRGDGRTTGPVIGVHSLSSDSGFKSFFGSTEYNQWQFTANILPAVSILPGNANLTRANSDWVGRPFPAGLAPQQGGGPEPGQGGLPGEERRPRRQRTERSRGDG